MKSLPERIMEHAEAAVGQALSRLARSGRLMRICDEGCGSLVPPRII